LNRIAAELNRVFAEDHKERDWPYFLRRPFDVREQMQRGSTALGCPQRWHEFVLSTAEAIRVELGNANRRMKPDGFGYSAKGPVAKIVVRAIPLVTGETPTALAVAKELERQLKRRSAKPAAASLSR
jgi:hypothetical protein